MDFETNLENSLNINYTNDYKFLKNSNFNVILINSRSCRKKLDEIELFLYEIGFEVDIIIFTESWLKKK